MQEVIPQLERVSLDYELQSGLENCSLILNGYLARLMDTLKPHYENAVTFESKTFKT